MTFNFDEKALHAELRRQAGPAMRREGQRMLAQVASEVNERGLGAQVDVATQVLREVTNRHGVTLDDETVAGLAEALAAGEPVTFTVGSVEWDH